MPLKTLKLEGVQTLSDANLEQIVTMLPQLENLNLIMTGITNQGVKIICRLPFAKIAARL